MPNYGVPDAAVSFSFNELVLEAAAADDRVSCGLWVSPRPQDAELNAGALAHAGEKGVKVLKTSFLLGGTVDDPACAPQLDQIFDTARTRGLVVHVHTSTGGASDIDQIGALVDRYGDDVKIHLVHLGGGVSAHIKLIGSRFFDWIEAGKQVYTDTSWAVGFAPRWLVKEIERRGIGQDRLLFASDEPWGDHVASLPVSVQRPVTASSDRWSSETTSPPSTVDRRRSHQIATLLVTGKPGPVALPSSAVPSPPVRAYGRSTARRGSSPGAP
jgi:predicted TIM-barrel fold metal-dependent hydrolase